MADMTTSTTWKECVQGFIRNKYISPSGNLQNHGYKALLINRFRSAVVPVGPKYRESFRRVAKRLRIFIQK
jgi:hypothetical protein